MKKSKQTYDLPIPDDDYKMAAVMENHKANFESPNIWLYVGADLNNPNFVKVGITMGDLSTRSSSTTHPGYYLFCAFQCYHNTTVEELKQIEQGALNYLDSVFGQDKRARHTESQRLSECYLGINFEIFFAHLHAYLWDHHIRHFQTAEYVHDTNPDWVYGSALSWEFNPRVSYEDRKRYLALIIQ